MQIFEGWFPQCGCQRPFRPFALKIIQSWFWPMRGPVESCATHAHYRAPTDWLIGRLQGLAAATVVVAAGCSRKTGYTRKTFRPPRYRWEAVKICQYVYFFWWRQSRVDFTERSRAPETRNNISDHWCVVSEIRMHHLKFWRSSDKVNRDAI